MTQDEQLFIDELNKAYEMSRDEDNTLYNVMRGCGWVFSIALIGTIMYLALAI